MELGIDGVIVGLGLLQIKPVGWKLKAGFDAALWKQNFFSRKPQFLL